MGVRGAGGSEDVSSPLDSPVLVVGALVVGPLVLGALVVVGAVVVGVVLDALVVGALVGAAVVGSAVESVVALVVVGDVFVVGPVGTLVVVELVPDGTVAGSPFDSPHAAPSEAQRVRNNGRRSEDAFLMAFVHERYLEPLSMQQLAPSDAFYVCHFFSSLDDW
jgi:hypothetical protein